VGVAVVDLLTGVYAVVAIQAALAAREKIGRGQHIDMSLLDTMTSILSNPGLSYLVSGKVPRRMGNGHQSIVPYQDFPTRDGPVIIAVGNDAQFRQLTGILGVPALADDPRYRSNEARVANRATLVARIGEVTAGLERQDLLERLEAAGVPAGAINRIDEVFADRQVIHRRLRLDLDRGDGGTVPTIRSPIVFSASEAVYERPSPRLGEHSREILGELGYEPAAIEGLLASGAVRQA
jgi:crotonobetainyl-CoA:carnitine CoA-transferase CaiB-like acyl-CoA transferase